VNGEPAPDAPRLARGAVGERGIAAAPGTSSREMQINGEATSPAAAQPAVTARIQSLTVSRSIPESTQVPGATPAGPTTSRGPRSTAIRLGPLDPRLGGLRNRFHVKPWNMVSY
jgi:hypothetical protein